MAVRHPTVVVTGANGAIGSATVEALKSRGANVIAMTRASLDLSSMASVRAAARELNRTAGHIDALLNIAAIFTTRWKKTKDGFELMLATNHLGPFLLTNLLRDRLQPGGRVITVTAPSTTRVDMGQLLDRDRFNAMHSFGATKAANLIGRPRPHSRPRRHDGLAVQGDAPHRSTALDTGRRPTRGAVAEERGASRAGRRLLVD